MCMVQNVEMFLICIISSDFARTQQFQVPSHFSTYSIFFIEHVHISSINLEHQQILVGQNH